MSTELSEEDVGGLVRTVEKRKGKKNLKDYETWELEQELRRRKELVFAWSRMDIKTCCDQTNGLLSDKCVDDILEKYDVEGDLLTATTEVMEDILHDYECEEGKLEYDG